MVTLLRVPENPILRPRYEQEWEGFGAFNGSVVWDGRAYHMVYRAQSSEIGHRGVSIRLSTIGYARSGNGIHFDERRQLIVPEHEWEAFGCEDPRVTRIGDRYYIFYTALSGHPPNPGTIKVGVALTGDFETIDEKHPVTTFNSKAMALFPEPIDGRLAAVLTVHTDLPPAVIAYAEFDEPAQIWSADYWADWYANLDRHAIPLLRAPVDQVEVGAAPIHTEQGWLLLYAEIAGYTLDPGARVFGIEAALLDLDDPTRVIGRTFDPILHAEAPYELRGFVPRVAFPSGALVRGDTLNVYYGAADTGVALATIDLESLLDELLASGQTGGDGGGAADGDGRGRRHAAVAPGKLVRAAHNPIMTPRPELGWEARAVFNPAAFELDGTVHILYRALSHDDTSTVGYATSADGLTLNERLTEPVYVPREPFEAKLAGGNSGCEDPRATLIDDRVHLLYTAFNGYDARVALSTISLDDFRARAWDRWAKPYLISAPEVWDKNATLFPRRIDGRYALTHRLSIGIWVDLVDDLEALQERWLGGTLIMGPRPDRWDNRKIGASAPPIETEVGWLFLYHGIHEPGTIYRAGAALLDRDDPTRVIARTRHPLLEPQMPWETGGLVGNVVFPCGAVVRDDTLFVYYGGGDAVVAVATTSLSALLDRLVSGRL